MVTLARLHLLAETLSLVLALQIVVLLHQSSHRQLPRGLLGTSHENNLGHHLLNLCEVSLHPSKTLGLGGRLAFEPMTLALRPSAAPFPSQADEKSILSLSPVKTKLLKLFFHLLNTVPQELRRHGGHVLLSLQFFHVSLLLQTQESQVIDERGVVRVRLRFPPSSAPSETGQPQQQRFSCLWCSGGPEQHRTCGRHCNPCMTGTS